MDKTRVDEQVSPVVNKSQEKKNLTQVTSNSAKESKIQNQGYIIFKSPFRGW